MATEQVWDLALSLQQVLINSNRGEEEIDGLALEEHCDTRASMDGRATLKRFDESGVKARKALRLH